MPTMIKAKFESAKIRLMEIGYDCDLSRGGNLIPLGVIADLSLSDVYGLGLVARKTLSADESARIGRLIRNDFAAPFAYLRDSIFRPVFKAADPAKAFAALADEHTHSLRFHLVDKACVSIKPPKPIVTADSDARKLWVKDELIAHCNTAYWSMYPDHVPAAVDKDVEENSRKLAA